MAHESTDEIATRGAIEQVVGVVTADDGAVGRHHLVDERLRRPHGAIGKLVAHRVVELLDDPAERERLGAQARQRAVERYDLRSVCLPAQLDWIEGFVEACDPRKASTGSA